MHAKQIPLKLENHRHIYSDFGSRLGAMLLDLLIMCPILIPILIINSQSMALQYYTLFFNLVFGLFYMVYLPKRYGGTPGKLICGLKIVKIDGSDIDWKEAFLRYSVSFAIAVIMATATLAALMKADAESFDAMNWLEQTQYLQSFSPAFQTILMWINMAWFLADIIVYFTNDRGRALHDMLGDTVVIRKMYDEKIKEFMKGEPETIENTQTDLPSY